MSNLQESSWVLTLELEKALACNIIHRICPYMTGSDYCDLNRPEFRQAEKELGRGLYQKIIGNLNPVYQDEDHRGTQWCYVPSGTNNLAILFYERPPDEVLTALKTRATEWMSTLSGCSIKRFVLSRVIVPEPYVHSSEEV